MPVHYTTLFVAIAFETTGTTALQAGQQFTRLAPSIIVVVAYGLSFSLLALTIRHIFVGIVYAIWSGLGIVCIAAIGFAVLGQHLDLPAILGIGPILSGVAVIHLFSSGATH